MTLHQIFERQAVSHGDKLALHFQDERYTYAQLNTLSNQLAWLLQEHYAVSIGDSESLEEAYQRFMSEAIKAKDFIIS